MTSEEGKTSGAENDLSSMGPALGSSSVVKTLPDQQRPDQQRPEPAPRPAPALPAATPGASSSARIPVFVASGPPPEAVGGFKIVAPLEASVLGRTFRGVRETDNLPVIIKLFERDDVALRGRVWQALEALKKVDHQNFARVVDYGESAGLFFYALAVPDCVTLLDFVRRGRPLDGAEVAWCGAQIASALHALHERNLPHGDVTPVNVGICGDGSVKLVDLGWTPRMRDLEFGSRHADAVAQDLSQLGATLVFATTGQAVKSARVTSGRHGRVSESGISRSSSGSAHVARKSLLERAAWLTPTLASLLELLADDPQQTLKAFVARERFLECAKELGITPDGAPSDLVETARHLTGTRTAGADRTTAGATSPGSPQPPPLGAFGRYVLQEEIARGGMGVVYRARHKELERTFALKVLLSGDLTNEVARRRFLREAEAAAQLDHPSIVRVHDFGEHEGRAYIAMDFAEGPSLGALLNDATQGATRLFQLFAKVADAVHYAHSRGIIHRDLKPQNVVVDQTDTPRILDFGVAKRLDESRPGQAGAGLTTEGELVGTPAYMPPEQAEGRAKDIDTRSDVYALGVMLFELASRGRLPFEGLTVTDVLTKVLLDDPPPPSKYRKDVPWEIDAIVLKAIEKDPRKRYQSAAELASDVRSFLDGLPVTARRATALYRARKWAIRHRRFAPFVAVAALAVAAIPVWIERDRAHQAAKERQRFEGLIQKGTAALASPRDPDKMREAMSLFGAALESDRSSTEATAGYTRAEMQLRRYEEERDTLQRAAALDDFRRSAAREHLKKGDDLLARADAVAAREEFYLAGYLDPSSEEARKGLTEANRIEFERKRSQDEADRKARDLAEARRLVAAGRSALEQRDHEAAQRAFVQALGFDASSEDAKAGIRDAFAVEEALAHERSLAKARALVEEGEKKLQAAKTDASGYAPARQDFVQALVFDGSSQDALRGIQLCDEAEREIAWEAERQRKRDEAGALVKRGRLALERARGLTRDGADRAAIRTAYYTAIESFDRASFILPEDRAAAGEKRDAARELATVAKNQQDWALSEYLFRISGTSAETAAVQSLATGDSMVVVEASATNLQNAFREPLEFEEKETRDFLSPVRDLVEPKKDRYRLRVEIRSTVTAGSNPTIHVTGVALRLDDLKRNTTSAPREINFKGEGYTRVVIAGTTGRIVPSLRKSLANGAAEELAKIRDATAEMLDAADKRP